jgi:hypothetical protein
MVMPPSPAIVPRPLQADSLGHILTIYDGLPNTAMAVEHAFMLARRLPASIFIVGIARRPETTTGGFPPPSPIVDDLIAYIHLGRRLGLDVDGQCLEEVSRELVERLIARQRIDQVVLPKFHGYPQSGTALLARDLMEACPVPLVICDDGSPKETP